MDIDELRQLERGDFGRMLASLRRRRPRVCPVCGRKFETMQDRGTYCSVRCRVKASRARRHAQAPAEEMTDA